MKSLLIALTAGAALSAGLATAASAAPGGHGYQGHAPAYNSPQHGGPRAQPARAPAWVSIAQRKAVLERRIDMGQRNGAISRSEAVRLRAEFNNLQRLEYRYRQDGLTRWEMADLDRRMDGLSARIHVERRDGDRRYGQGYGQDYRR
ncbi:hypothetical protein [Phenylobacterium sp.]|uniref:hypothetical protein n=1 Tax=Phenylobacterium sp. TaxID=1871053 RepID=UPI0027306C09|nr:hypothetical protein [Phenylobacterium sp.]MDP1615887.1 hypothetical protein [Phenylobacterium sp.]MDP1985665.1 hypothetical protein [Phenylobacterium sp.]